MTLISLIVGNATVVFDTSIHPDGFIAQINKQLSLVGAKASFAAEGNPYAIRVDICAGQSVVISQMYSNSQWAADLGDATQYYLDIELDVGCCHDGFGGIIGQMYKCKYAKGEKFVWDGTTEETYRLPSLEESTGTFNVNANCFEKHEFGVLLDNGKTTASMK